MGVIPCGCKGFKVYNCMRWDDMRFEFADIICDMSKARHVP